MLLTDLAQQIAGNYGKWKDTEFIRRCEDLIISSRAELIRQYVDKYRVTPNNVLQQINCLDTTQVEISECCSVDLGCTVTRSLIKIPKPIRIRSRNSNFKYVGTIDSKTTYSYMTPEEMEFLSSERFLRKTAVYTYVNGYLYIYGDNPQHIRVQGVFGDPREVEELNNCGDEGCAEEIDIDVDMAHNIKILVSGELRNTRPVIDETEIELQKDGNNT